MKWKKQSGRKVPICLSFFGGQGIKPGKRMEQVGQIGTQDIIPSQRF